MMDMAVNSYLSGVHGFKLFQMKGIVQNASTTYMSIGKGTPWDESDTVPMISPDLLELTEITALKRVDELKYAYMDENGPIEHLDKRWAITDDIEVAKQKLSKWLYIKVKLEYNKVPVSEFRQLGLFTEVQLQDDVTETDVITPENVKDYGFLLVVNNRSQMLRASDQKEYVEFIIEISKG